MYIMYYCSYYAMHHLCRVEVYIFANQLIDQCGLPSIWSS